MRLNFKINTWDRRFMFKKKFFKHKHNRYHKTLLPQQKHSPDLKYKIIGFLYTFFCINLAQTQKRYKAVYKTNNGVFLITPLMDCVGFLNKCTVYKNAFRFYLPLSTGSIVFLHQIKLLFLLSNVGNFKPKYAVSQGTYIRVLNLTVRFCATKLPSGLKKTFSLNNNAILGRNSGIYTNKQYLGKASTQHQKLNKIIVRSCAKNPVDHPNGGRTRGKQKFKTPWGKIAKKNK